MHTYDKSNSRATNLQFQSNADFFTLIFASMFVQLCHSINPLPEVQSIWIFCSIFVVCFSFRLFVFISSDLDEKIFAHKFKQKNACLSLSSSIENPYILFRELVHSRQMIIRFWLALSGSLIEICVVGFYNIIKILQPDDCVLRSIYIV